VGGGGAARGGAGGGEGGVERGGGGWGGGGGGSGWFTYDAFRPPGQTAYSSRVLAQARGRGHAMWGGERAHRRRGKVVFVCYESASGNVLRQAGRWS